VGSREPVNAGVAHDVDMRRSSVPKYEPGQPLSASSDALMVRSKLLSSVYWQAPAFVSAPVCAEKTVTVG
jgi:hypothetical protein